MADFFAIRYNGGLALLRRTKRAIESGHVATNEPAALKRVQPRKIEQDLPTSEDFAKIMADIFGQKKRLSKATAVAVEFLTSTELRISAAQKIRFRNIRPEWLITATAKNEDLRQAPPIFAALDLLNRLKLAEVPSGPNDPAALVKSPRIALGNFRECPTRAESQPPN